MVFRVQNGPCCYLSTLSVVSGLEPSMERRTCTNPSSLVSAEWAFAISELPRRPNSLLGPSSRSPLNLHSEENLDIFNGVAGRLAIKEAKRIAG